MRTLTLLLSFAVAAGALGAESSFTSPHLRKDVGIRAAGMGGAFAALADDSTAVFWNPAGVSSLPAHGVDLHAVLGHAEDIHNYSLSGVLKDVPIGIGKVDVGLGFRFLSVLGVDSYTADDAVADSETFDYMAYVGTLALAKRFEQTDVGGSLDFDTRMLADATAFGLSASVGVRTTIAERFLVGMAIKDLAILAPSFAEEESDFDESAGAYIRIGAGARPFKTQVLTVLADVDFTTRELLNWRVGGESWLDVGLLGGDRLAVRAGVKNLSIALGGTYEIPLSTMTLSIHYAFVSEEAAFMGETHQVSLGVLLGKRD